MKKLLLALGLFSVTACGSADQEALFCSIDSSDGQHVMYAVGSDECMNQVSQ